MPGSLTARCPSTPQALLSLAGTARDGQLLTALSVSTAHRDVAHWALSSSRPSPCLAPCAAVASRAPDATKEAAAKHSLEGSSRSPGHAGRLESTPLLEIIRLQQSGSFPPGDRAAEPDAGPASSRRKRMGRELVSRVSSTAGLVDEAQRSMSLTKQFQLPSEAVLRPAYVVLSPPPHEEREQQAVRDGEDSPASPEHSPANGTAVSPAASRPSPPQQRQPPGAEDDAVGEDASASSSAVHANGFHSLAATGTPHSIARPPPELCEGARSPPVEARAAAAAALRAALAASPDAAVSASSSGLQAAPEEVEERLGRLGAREGEQQEAAEEANRQAAAAAAAAGALSPPPAENGASASHAEAQHSAPGVPSLLLAPQQELEEETGRLAAEMERLQGLFELARADRVAKRDRARRLVERMRGALHTLDTQAPYLEDDPGRLEAARAEATALLQRAKACHASYHRRAQADAAVPRSAMSHALRVALERKAESSAKAKEQRERTPERQPTPPRSPRPRTPRSSSSSSAGSEKPRRPAAAKKAGDRAGAGAAAGTAAAAAAAAQPEIVATGKKRRGVPGPSPRGRPPAS